MMPFNANEDGSFTLDANTERLWLNMRMELLKLTPATFAKALGVSRQFMYRMLKGDEPITPKIMAKLNELDPEHELQFVILVSKKKRSKRAAKV